MNAPDPLRARLAAALGARYTLERELTGGGMARVFVAHEVALNRRVVIKTLAPELAASLSAERFDREIQLVAALQQANIVGVLTSGTVDGVPWFAMPYVEGDSLRARLARGPVSEGEAVPILRDVARALAYAHDRGVVHRDIKPDNILLSGDAAVVTDFGIAKAVTAARTQTDLTSDASGPITSAGISLGTPAYMAPEQAAADAQVDRRADLYALGCVAYELVAGRPPFTGASAAELLRAHLLAPAPAIPAAAGVSTGYARLVAQCLAKDPAQRPASARDVLRALEQLGGTGEAASPERGLVTGLLAWAATLGATYVLARAAVVGIGLPEETVTWATWAAALGLPVVLATWWIKRAARRAQLATPTWTPGGTLSQTTMAGLALKASPYATWRRARRFTLSAVGGVAILVAVLLGLRGAHMGPWRPAVRGGALLLADFSAAGSDSTLGEALTQAMRTALQESATLQVVPRDAVGLVLQRMARDSGTAIAAPVAREVAQRAGIPLIITGRVSAAGSGFLVTATLESAVSGAALVTVQRGARGADDLLGAIDWLARRLREKAGDSYRTVGAAPPLAEVTTASLPALRAFSRAVELVERQGRFAEAVPLLLEAIRLDSTFASAWRFAATYGWVSGRPGTEVIRFSREAYRQRQHGTSAERADIEGLYTSLTNSRAHAEAIPPTDSPQVVAIHRLRALRELGRSEDAAALALAALRADSAAHRPSSYSTYQNLAAAQEDMGRLPEARRTLAELERHAPDAFLTQVTGMRMAWRAGGVDSLEARLRAPSETANLQMVAARVELQAVAIGLRGRLRDYAEAARRAEANPPTGIRSMYTVQHAVTVVVATAVHRAQRARGVLHLDALRRADPQRGLAPMDRRDPELASAYAQLGRPDLARPLLENYLRALDADQRLYAWARWRLAEGEIALAEGRVDDAITAFRKAGGADSGRTEPAWSGRVSAALGRAYDRGGRSDSASTHFARLADGSLPMDGPLTLPIALRRLGELAEARADLPEAIRRYRAFVQLWRNADPELQPQVADVRRRIAALEAREARAR